MRPLGLAVLLAGFAALPAYAHELATADTLECKGNDGVVVQITVGKIDVIDDEETIVSVSLFNDAAGVAVPEAGHLPFGIDAIKGCREVARRPVSKNFAEGYAIWRKAFDAGEGGYFTVTPPKVYQFLLQQVPK